MIRRQTQRHTYRQTHRDRLVYRYEQWRHKQAQQPGNFWTQSDQTRETLKSLLRMGSNKIGRKNILQKFRQLLCEFIVVIIKYYTYLLRLGRVQYTFTQNKVKVCNNRVFLPIFHFKRNWYTYRFFPGLGKLYISNRKL